MKGLHIVSWFINNRVAKPQTIFLLLFFIIQTQISLSQEQKKKIARGINLTTKHSGFYLDQKYSPSFELGVSQEVLLFHESFIFKQGLNLNLITMNESGFNNFGMYVDVDLGKAFYLNFPVEIIFNGKLMFWSIGMSGNLLLKADFHRSENDFFKRMYFGAFVKIGKRIYLNMNHLLNLEVFLNHSLTPFYGYRHRNGRDYNRSIIELGLGVGLIRKSPK